VPASSAQNTIQLLYEHVYKTTVVYTPYDTDYEARLKSVNWCLQGTHAGETDTKHGLFGSEAWFHPSEYVTS
jgi:hypothetical protein